VLAGPRIRDLDRLVPPALAIAACHLLGAGGPDRGDSFFDVVEDEEGHFGGFVHVDDWVPQRLVTATGPNPLPR
jgi:hypothetical protein